MWYCGKVLLIVTENRNRENFSIPLPQKFQSIEMRRVVIVRKSFPQRHPLHYAMQRSVQGKQSNREKGWQYVPIYGMVRVEVKPDSVERRTCNGGCKNKNYECLWCSV